MKNVLGKWKNTSQLGNSFWIKNFTKGVRIRKRGQGEITLFHSEVGFLAGRIKNYHEPKLHFQFELKLVYQKFPETREFIERIINDELKYKEMEEIVEEYNKNQKTKEEVIEGLR